MEKTFRRYQTSRAAREAFTEVEAITSLANQIRVIRIQRGWTQKELAKQLKTTQTVISRLEDSSYGRISFKTFIALAHVFDVAPVMKFESTIRLLRDRWKVSLDDLHVPAFEEEAAQVAFDDGQRVITVQLSSTVGSAAMSFRVTAESMTDAKSLNLSHSLFGEAQPLYVTAR